MGSPWEPHGVPMGPLYNWHHLPLFQNLNPAEDVVADLLSLDATQPEDEAGAEMTKL